MMSGPQQNTDRMDVSTFEIELTQLIESARNDETQIRGVYDVRTPRPDEPDYTVEITEVAKQSVPWRRDPNQG